MNRNAVRLIGATVMGLLIITGCGVGSGAPAGTGDSTVAPSSTTAPTPPTATSPTASLLPSLDTTTWVPFSSDRFGYDIAIPPNWTADAATRDWSLEADNEVTPAADNFVDKRPGVYQIGVQAFSTPVSAGTTNEEWIAATTGSMPGCTPLPIDQWEAITVDGQAAMFNPDACDASQAFVFIGDRVYRFSVWRGGQQPLLKAFLSTVKFHPILPATSPSASP